MTPKDEKTLYDTLESLSTGTDVPPSDEAYFLEEILAEYGAGREQKILRDVEEKVTAGETGDPAPREPRGIRRPRMRVYRLPLPGRRTRRRSLPRRLRIRHSTKSLIPPPQSGFPLK